MKITGFQKLTLIDYPNRVACTLFLQGCNFKCGFCYNPELVLEDNGEIYSPEKILEFLKKRQIYLDGICITGGEPLLTLEINFLKQIKELGYDIKIDTNGSFPEKLKEIIESGLVDYVAMDVKGSKEDYEKITNSEVDISKIEESIKLISEMKDYEFRTTVIEKYHGAEEVEKIGKWLNTVCGKKPKKYCIQGFKNKGKFVDASFEKEQDVEEDYLIALKKVAEPYFEEVDIRV